MFKAPPVPSTAPLAQATATAPANPPMFGEAKPNAKPKAKSMQTTFLGSATSPTTGQTGSSTLLGGST